LQASNSGHPFAYTPAFHNARFNLSHIEPGAAHRHGVHRLEPIAHFDFVQLAAQQPRIDLPDRPALASLRRPLAEMGCECIVIQLQAIGGKHRRRAWREALPQFVHKGHGIVMFSADRCGSPG
jgi:hypothetical protein